MTYKRHIIFRRALLALLLLVFAAFSYGGNFSVAPVSAAGNSKYTDVMEDLLRDSAFDSSIYPDIADDYSLSVIQIAESTAGELFVYAYHPSAQTKFLPATSINISTAINESLYYRNYMLTLLSARGVFAKYLVNDFTVKADALRYYDISAIYRAFDSDIDTAPDNGTTISEVAFPVAKLFTASTVDGTVSYTCIDTTVIDIINPFVDFLRYSDGYGWDFFNPVYEYTDVHYIAFDTDMPIDALMEADISFSTQSYTRRAGIPDYELEDDKTTHEPVTIQGTETGETPADGLFAKKYTWKRIQATSEFINTDGLKDETIATIQNTKWVLLFYETEVVRDPGQQPGHWIEYGTKVSEVAILRLKFVTDGIVYNLGAVSDKVTGDNIPGNDNTNEWDIPEFFGDGLFGLSWETLIMIAAGIVLLIILMPFLPTIASIIVWIISLPFKLIAGIVNGIKKAVNKPKKE